MLRRGCGWRNLLARRTARDVGAQGAHALGEQAWPGRIRLRHEVVFGHVRIECPDALLAIRRNRLWWPWPRERWLGPGHVVGRRVERSLDTTEPAVHTPDLGRAALRGDFPDRSGPARANCVEIDLPFGGGGVTANLAPLTGEVTARPAPSSRDGTGLGRATPLARRPGRIHPALPRWALDGRCPSRPNGVGLSQSARARISRCGPRPSRPIDVGLDHRLVRSTMRRSRRGPPGGTWRGSDPWIRIDIHHSGLDRLRTPMSLRHGQDPNARVRLPCLPRPRIADEPFGTLGIWGSSCLRRTWRWPSARRPGADRPGCIRWIDRLPRVRRCRYKGAVGRLRAG
jgi:hypothetical protein